LKGAVQNEAGVIIANLMFALPAVTVSSHVRSGTGLWLGEIVASFGLLLVVFGVTRGGRSNAAPFAVGAYITGAYFFTSSTSFANPAVTLARTLSETFAGIAPSSVLPFVVAQLVGTALACVTVRVLWPLAEDLGQDVVVPPRDGRRGRVARTRVCRSCPGGAVARVARREDAAAIARIYNQGIEERIATFETEPRSVADIERLLADRDGRYPAIVVERGGEVVAWASAGSYRSRACYDSIAEHSVYVDRSHRGTGVGRMALEALIADAERRGFFKLVSRIFPENAASLALHRNVGFREVGVYSRRGKLDGVWRDYVIVERLLGEAMLS